MKILVTPTSFLKPENAAAKQLLETFFDEIVYNDLGVPLEGEQILARVEGCDAYLAGLDYLTGDVIRRLPDSVRVISRYGAGVDRVDLQACRARGIVVANTPGANATAVCELAFGLMLCCARNLVALHRQVEQGLWPRTQGIELAGKTLGIIGMGAIGKRLALRAKAFEMQVVAHDPFLDAAFAARHGIAGLPVDELLGQSDVVSLHTPLSEQTRHLINAQRLQSMRPGAILINTARGGLIDEEAAAQALRTGRLGALGLDAFEHEPLTGSPLLGLERVVLTPHTGAQTAEAVANMGMGAVQNAIAILQNNPCSCVISERKVGNS